MLYEVITPEENQIYIPLELFTNLKLDRNDAMRVAGSQIKINDEYVQSDPDRNNGKNRIKVKGSPNLGNVEVFMMGIRNRRGQLNTGPKSVEVWTRNNFV